ncbi:MAG TPA: zf-HC2 domain-containing protein [Gemmatimonadaceae bacterium]|nr:zf-HC2 domain-containing protein [Gemmatimonadaceae bacterium]
MIALTCDRFEDRLSALMEGETAAAEREQLEAHASACSRCGPLLVELRAIVREAGDLPELLPSRDLWEGVAARIETPVVQIEPRQAPLVVRRGLSWRTAAAAAAVLVALTALATWRIAATGVDSQGTERIAAAVEPPVTAPPSNPSAGTTPPVDTAPAPDRMAPAPRSLTARPRATTPAVSAPAVRNAAADAATAVYDREIASLRSMLDTRRAELDSATVRVLEENLTIIDRAIAQSRQALAQDPNSTFLIDHLNSALGRKVQLLRTVTLIPASS